MDKYLGDLADIVRASGGAIANNTATTSTTTTTTTTTTTITTGEEMPAGWEFGSPGTTTTTNSINNHSYELQDLYTFADPLLREIDAISSPGPFLNMGVEDSVLLFSNTGGPMQELPASAPSNNIFSPRMIQISPNNTTINNSNNICSISNSNSNSNGMVVKLQPIQAAASPPQKVLMKRSFDFMSNEMMSMSNTNNNASCSMSPKGGFNGGGNTTGLLHHHHQHHQQIPSPRNPGIKRRKSQAKKVVCIPAPAAANSRATGEVVPSDLWAWRKYGQKPIKGSPFPRGYYRCSSSKGCLARKQVERSRTDPNMLVITYTSEHNHPWPTQRNALAGSSRSQPPKGTTTVPSESQTQANDQLLPNQKEKVLVKEEVDNKDTSHHGDDLDTGMMANYNAVKEEVRIDGEIGNTVDDEITNNGDYEGDQLIDSFRPANMSESSRHRQADRDFFTDLVEFDGDDPLKLLFTQETKGSDPFNGYFDWTQNNSVATTTTTTTASEKNNQHNASTSDVG